MTSDTINSTYTFPSGLTVKNRLVKAACTEGLANEYGQVTKQLETLYGTWGTEADLGMLITGNVQVDRRFLERPGNVCIDIDYKDQVDEQKDALKRWVEAGKQKGSRMICQLGHAGRQSISTVAKQVPAFQLIHLK